MKDIKNTLDQYNQDHLLQFIDSISDTEKQSFINHLKSIDYKAVTAVFKNNVHNAEESIASLEPLPFKTIESTTTEDLERWFSFAKKAFCKGEIAAFLVAGGQGSRLGYDGPKGAFDMGLPSGKSLFQLQSERLLNLKSHYGVTVPWYIMTSSLNYDATLEHFKKYDYFGYPESDIHFFNQGMIPAFSEDGKILMQSKSEVALVPDGNGGCFSALHKSGMLQDMKDRGVKHVFLYGVDNALIEVCDPEYVGFYLSEKKAASAKVVKKAYPEEKVGLFALRNGLPGVIEYSDIDDETRKKVDSEGNLIFDGGNIAVHMVAIEAIERLKEEPLPYHTAFKKVGYINEKKVFVTPNKENAYKFEQFMFDIFTQIGELSLFEVNRSSEFAPIKNAEGNDSPATAYDMVLKLHTKWLVDAGITIDSECYYEISPLVSCYGENLSQHIFDEAISEGSILSVKK